MAQRNGVLIDVTNSSDHTFRLDGEVLMRGRWASEPAAPILPHSRAQFEIASSAFGGAKGMLWWIDDHNRTVYLSMTFNHPRFEPGSSSSTFSCCAGFPPANLMDDMANAERLALEGVELAPEGANCTWRTAALGSLLIVEVYVHADLPEYLAPERGGSPAWAHARPATSASTPTTASSESSRAELFGERGSGAAASSSAPSSLQAFRDKTRPRDFAHGLASGLKTARLGAAASVVLPAAWAYQGAKEQGAWGFVKGLGLGVLGGAAAAAGGGAACVVQVGRGITHSATAMAGRREEKVWDPELGDWVDIDLCALAADLDSDSSRDDDAVRGWGASGSSASVADTTFYDLLGVPPSASTSEIKRAYYQEARRCHPDKNPEDETATARFQQLAKAYQVLSDPDFRKRYDAKGDAGLEDALPRIDPSIFFGLLFGPERFLDYTGELHIAMLSDHMAAAADRWAAPGSHGDFREGAAEQEPKAMARRQMKREVRCAVFLRDKLELLVSQRSQAAFVEQISAEAADLAEARFGPELLLELGEMYKIRAEIWLANARAGRWSLVKRAAAAKRSQHIAKTKISLRRGVAASLVSVQRISHAVKREERRMASGDRCYGDELNGRIEGAVEKALPSFLRAAWAAVARDLDQTVTNVGRNLLQDKSVPWQIRYRRAQALFLLGELFCEAGSRALAAGGRAAILGGLTSEAARATVLDAAMDCATGASRGDRRASSSST